VLPDTEDPNWMISGIRRAPARSSRRWRSTSWL